MTAARKRRMKTSGAIRTTFAPCRCWSARSARKRRCLALPRSRSMVTTILDCVMVKTEDSSRVMTRRRREKSPLVAGVFAFQLRRVVLERRRRGDSRRENIATATIRFIYRRIYEPFSISWLCSANDSTSLKSESHSSDKCDCKISIGFIRLKN